MNRKEITTNELMEFLREHMFTKEDGDALLARINAVETRVNAIETRVNSIGARQEKDSDALLARIITIEEKMDDFVSKRDLAEMREEIVGLLDRSAKKQDIAEAEMAAMHSKYGRIEARLAIVEKKLGLASRS